MIQGIEVVLGISVLIFLHELGHFVAAKRCGVRVETFAVGFGPALVSFQRGGTSYKLCCIPLGGYIKMAGEQEEGPHSGKPDEFLAKSPGQRAIILGAGVAMNAAFAVFAFVVALSMGMRFTPTRVGYVERGTPAWVQGIKPGDVIRKVRGRPIDDFEDLVPTIAFTSPKEVLEVEIDRDGQRLIKQIAPQYDSERGMARLGIQPASSLEVEQIFEFEGKCPARDAGLQVEDKVVWANGPVSSWADLHAVLYDNPGKPVAMKVERAGRTLALTVTPAATTRWMIGLTCQRAMVEAVRRGSPACASGLRAGDRLVRIDGRPVRGWAQVASAFEATTATAIPFAADRNGVTVTGALVVPEGHKPTDLLADIVAETGLTIDSLLEGFPAEQMGLKVGDRVVALDLHTPNPLGRLARSMGFYSGQLSTWDDLHRAVADSEGRTLTATYERDGREYVGLVRPTRTDMGSGGQIGITPRRETVVRRFGLLAAITKGMRKSIISIKQVYLTVRGVATREVSGKNVGGIVAIAQASYYKAKEGLVELLYLLGIISVQLAVLNALPVPVLDGGHLFFLLIEKIKGKPVHHRIQAAANYVGLALLLTLVAYATRNDIMRLLS